MKKKFKINDKKDVRGNLGGLEHIKTLNRAHRRVQAIPIEDIRVREATAGGIVHQKGQKSINQGASEREQRQTSEQLCAGREQDLNQRKEKSSREKI